MTQALSKFTQGGHDQLMPGSPVRFGFIGLQHLAMETVFSFCGHGYAANLLNFMLGRIDSTNLPCDQCSARLEASTAYLQKAKEPGTGSCGLGNAAWLATSDSFSHVLLEHGWRSRLFGPLPNTHIVHSHDVNGDLSLPSTRRKSLSLSYPCWYRSTFFLLSKCNPPCDQRLGTFRPRTPGSACLHVQALELSLVST